jgi:hypothetical protein
VGSAVNAIGAPASQPVVLADSNDPLGAVERLFEARGLRDEADELREARGGG